MESSENHTKNQEPLTWNISKHGTRTRTRTSNNLAMPPGSPGNPVRGGTPLGGGTPVLCFPGCCQLWATVGQDVPQNKKLHLSPPSHTRATPLPTALSTRSARKLLGSYRLLPTFLGFVLFTRDLPGFSSSHVPW